MVLGIKGKHMKTLEPIILILTNTLYDDSLESNFNLIYNVS